ncbi:MAG: transporter substrate-binding domain-containing protein [Anaerolineae bacterium]|nr:transporter substrate-binding domain-containing protein [Anaerolineae bacterium]MCX8068537.1 transporter substrate-binding domain-containing protein [Anaerolineae bacterium]MDW7991791.1 transporter substrate-binding domain-containing protein [Anaerolineae bacterium]
MKRLSPVLIVLIFALLIAACRPAATPPPDKLAEVLARGTLIVSTDPAYPPQSELVEGAQRVPNTKCTSDQRTATELAGFDIEVSKEVARRLGVEVCFVTPNWDLIVAGGWADRWDISIGSMTITPARMEKLYFSQPYYTTPAAFFVHKDNTTFQKPADLSGKRIGFGAATTYEYYLEGILEIPGEKFEVVVKDPILRPYDTDLFALQDLALGDGVRLDAVLTAQPTGASAIADGLPIKQLGDPVFFEYLAAAVDKAAGKDPVPLIKKVSEIIQQMHADGTLVKLSQQFYGLDLASPAAKFDLSALKQW